MSTSPNSWLFSDNARYSTRARLLFMGLSFAIGILTFLLYLAIWYCCTLRRRLSGGGSAGDLEDPTAAASTGMSDDAIAALPTFAYEGGAGEAAPECAVCLGQVEAGEKVRRLPKCAHSFHAECVDAWLRAHSTCPMCRAPVGAAPAAAANKTGAAAEPTAAPVVPAEAPEASPPV
ncbi:hypothetical protein ACP70R_030927 [Stipagrostis hirtigluma subsp. patula]